jgi:hypothetical protein
MKQAVVHMDELSKDWLVLFRLRTSKWNHLLHVEQGRLSDIVDV